MRMSRSQALENLYRFVWEEMETLESPLCGYSYVSNKDMDTLEHLCMAIDEAEYE
jgi:hypothetical protein